MPDGDADDKPAAESSADAGGRPSGEIAEPQSQARPDSLAKPEELLIHPED